MENEERVQPVVLKVTGIMADLKNGLTRRTSDLNYNPEIGSIEEKYGLSKSDVTELFRHPALRNLKTIVPKKPNFILEDDTVTNNTFGAPSIASQTRLHNALAEESVANNEPVVDNAPEENNVIEFETNITEEELQVSADGVVEESGEF
jgi:hypothetical protein